MSNILVTGCNGQLGSEIKILSEKYNHGFFYTGISDLDICDGLELETYITKNSIDIIINCAAYTAVDKAENNYELANAINHLAVKNLAEICKQRSLRLIHISTDYVFDGDNYRPYIETDPTEPNSVYGVTKLAGEIAMMAISPRNSIIFRTSWVYSGFGNNFVKTMLRLGRERDNLSVVFDQIGTPTYARDLAQAILNVIPSLNDQQVELYHYSNEGAISWYDFAQEIITFTGIDCKIKPIESLDYPTPAARPHFSVLNKAKFKNKYNLDIPYWKDSLSDCLKELKDEFNV